LAKTNDRSKFVGPANGELATDGRRIVGDHHATLRIHDGNLGFFQRNDEIDGPDQR